MVLSNFVGMFRYFSSFLLCISLISGASAQVYMKSGFSAGPNFSWPDGSSQLNNGFFGVTRTAFQAGICNSLQAGDHFFSKISVLYSMQNFAIRQTSDPVWYTDTRYSINRLEIPLLAGPSGFLGSLRHREYLGAILSMRLSEKTRVITEGDSSSVHLYQIQPVLTKPLALLLTAGFEVGTNFKNDASLYFGGSIRWGLNKIYTGEFSSKHFSPQQAVYKGSYVCLEITYYLPRYSYWFKREFTY